MSHKIILFSNLIENALKYSEAGATVRVTSKIATVRPCVVVEDDRHGHSQGSDSALFDRFYRVDKKAARAKEAAPVSGCP